MSPTLNRSSAIWHFKHSGAIEIRDGITFDFYAGLPHVLGQTVPVVSISMTEKVNYKPEGENRDTECTSESLM